MKSLLSPNTNQRALLDTLAQKRTGFGEPFAKPPVSVSGLGSDLHDTSALLGRAKRKTISQAMALALVDVATRKNKPERVKAYWNTYHCQNRIITSDDRIHGKYCKNRCCTLCSSIRKATLINKYFPVVEIWEDCHLVTLTVKAIPAKELSRYCKGLIKLFGKIIEKYRKRAKRGKGKSLEGIRSLECNFNPQTRTYNPHLHVLVRNREMGETLINEWLKRFPRKHANRKAQDMREVEDRVKCLIEIIKYGSKIFTELDLTKKRTKGITRYVYVSALDNILSAMEGSRIFDRFGFNCLSTAQAESSSICLSKYESWVYSRTNSDWINLETGELLCNYRLTSELEEILTNNLDLELC